MEHTNCVLILEAADVHAVRALRLPHNRNRYLPPNDQVNTVFSSETASASVPPNRQRASEEGRHQLRLSSDKPPKDGPRGWVFGSDPLTCDVLLVDGNGQLDEIGDQHFAISFDLQGRVILNSVSDYGTIVAYEGGGVGLGRGHTWVLVVDLKITTCVTKSALAFKVIWSQHRTREAGFRAPPSTYLEGCGDAIVPPTGCETGSQGSVAVPERPGSSEQGPVYFLGRMLGTGGFGAVFEARNGSTGEVCAAKKFPKAENFRYEEIELLKSASHVGRILASVVSASHPQAGSHCPVH